MKGRDSQAADGEHRQHQPELGSLHSESQPRTRQDDAHRQEPRHGQAVGKLAEERLNHDDVALSAKTRPAAAVYEKPRSATKNGNRAGTTPWQKSIRKWPMDRKAMARLFISRSLAGSDHARQKVVEASSRA